MKQQGHYFIKGKVRQPEPLHYRQCGLDNIFLINGFQRELVDGEEYVTIHNLEDLWKAIGLYIVKNQKTFTAQEVRFLRQQMDLTQAELAKMLRVTDQTIARWEKGKAGVDGTGDFALRVAFLLSPTSQPEGKEILDKFIDRIKTLSDIDEDVAAEAVFSRKGSKWNQVKRNKVSRAA